MYYRVSILCATLLSVNAAEVALRVPSNYAGGVKWVLYQDASSSSSPVIHSNDVQQYYQHRPSSVLNQPAPVLPVFGLQPGSGYSPPPATVDQAHSGDFAPPGAHAQPGGGYFASSPTGVQAQPGAVYSPSVIPGPGYKQDPAYHHDKVGYPTPGYNSPVTGAPAQFGSGYSSVTPVPGYHSPAQPDSGYQIKDPAQYHDTKVNQPSPGYLSPVSGGVYASAPNTKKVTVYKKKDPVNDYDTEVVDGLTGVPDLVPPYDYEAEQAYPAYSDYQDLKKPARVVEPPLAQFKVQEKAVEVTGPGYY